MKCALCGKEIKDYESPCTYKKLSIHHRCKEQMITNYINNMSKEEFNQYMVIDSTEKSFMEEILANQENKEVIYLAGIKAGIESFVKGLSITGKKIDSFLPLDFIEIICNCSIQNIETKIILENGGTEILDLLSKSKKRRDNKND